MAQELYLAAAFILGSDQNRCGQLLKDLENDYTRGQDNFPKTVTAAYSRLTNWKQNPRNVMRVTNSENDGVSFANVTDDEPDAEMSPTTTITTTVEEHQEENRMMPHTSHVLNAGRRDTTRAPALVPTKTNQPENSSGSDNRMNPKNGKLGLPC
jgi:hypothetical protein